MAKFRRFEGAFSWCFIELETHAVKRDICLVATVQRPNCSDNKGYIAYFYCACAKRPFFHFRSKIWRRIPWPRCSVIRENFGDCAINKRSHLFQSGACHKCKSYLLCLEFADTIVIFAVLERRLLQWRETEVFVFIIFAVLLREIGKVDNGAYNSTFAYSVYGTFDTNRPLR